MYRKTESNCEHCGETGVMYNRTIIRLMGLGAAGIAVVVEVLIFYSLFVQFDLLLSGSAPSVVVRNDIIFYTLITTLAVWAHELTGLLIELGDRMESRGETVWKRNRGLGNHRKRLQNFL